MNAEQIALATKVLDLLGATNIAVHGCWISSSHLSVGSISVSSGYNRPDRLVIRASPPAELLSQINKLSGCRCDCGTHVATVSSQRSAEAIAREVERKIFSSASAAFQYAQQQLADLLATESRIAAALSSVARLVSGAEVKDDAVVFPGRGTPWGVKAKVSAPNSDAGDLEFTVRGNAALMQDLLRTYLAHKSNNQ